jgi:hypothetical protein
LNWLLGNRHLRAERESIHAAMVRWLVHSDHPMARSPSPDSRRCWISTRSASISSLYVLIATAHVKVGKVLYVEFEPAPSKAMTQAS